MKQVVAQMRFLAIPSPYFGIFKRPILYGIVPPISGIFLLAKTVHWVATAQAPARRRVILCWIVGGLSIYLLVDLLRWVERRERSYAGNAVPGRASFSLLLAKLNEGRQGIRFWIPLGKTLAPNTRLSLRAGQSSRVPT